jgi:hypothetical protein
MSVLSTLLSAGTELIWKSQESSVPPRCPAHLLEDRVEALVLAEG